MEKFFAFFGKFALILFIVGAIAGAGYYFGVKTLNTTSAKPEAASTVAAPMSPTPTLDIGLMPEKKPESATLTAGLGPESGLSFAKYQITIPLGWTPVHTSENNGTAVDTLTVTNGMYELKIFQAATGGAMCLYPGDADFEGPSSRYDLFVQLTTKDGIILRRGTTNTVNGTKRGFTVCQKGSDNYGQPTGFGHMSYSTPTVADEIMLKELDEMVKSLKKI